MGKKIRKARNPNVERKYDLNNISEKPGRKPEWSLEGSYEWKLELKGYLFKRNRPKKKKG